jgi:hypothetical protein
MIIVIDHSCFQNQSRLRIIPKNQIKFEIFIQNKNFYFIAPLTRKNNVYRLKYNKKTQTIHVQKKKLSKMRFSDWIQITKKVLDVKKERLYFLCLST